MTERITQLVRIARGIETGGHYNVSKLIWALVYSEEVRASNESGILLGHELHQALQDLITDLSSQSAPPAFITALESGLDELRNERAGSLDVIPPVFVSRNCGDIFIGTRPSQTPCDEDPFDLREFRPHYYLEPAPVSELLDLLSTYPATISSILEEVDAEKMKVSPAPDEWSILGLLQHIEVTQQLLFNRTRQILSEENPVLMGVSAWILGTSELTAHDIFQRYSTSRAEVLDILRPLKPEDWWRPARHSEFGTITLQEHVSYFTRHERSHFRQFVQTVRALKE